MYEILKFLTQIHPARNYANVASLDKVAKFLGDELKSIGLDVYEQEYSVGKRIYKNVVASLNTKNPKRVVVGAHYDVCGNIEGADDNASAVAGVVETAKKLYKVKNKLSFRVDFVLFTLEEPPYFNTKDMGSYRYAQYLKSIGADVIGMINYEMIGYFTDEPNSQNYPIDIMKSIYPDRGNFIAMVSNESSQNFLNLLDFKSQKKQIESVEIILPPSLEPMTASDHLSFWGFGFDAIMITDTAHFRNPNYHTKNDTLETLDIQKMGYVVDLVCETISKIDYMKT
jgi:Zn-dependent M28 family amino/carboxypeptidase